MLSKHVLMSEEDDDSYLPSKEVCQRSMDRLREPQNFNEILRGLAAGEKWTDPSFQYPDAILWEDMPA